MRRKHKKGWFFLKEYAMYRGDKFIDIGTARELATKYNTTVKYIHWLAGSSVARERKNTRSLGKRYDYYTNRRRRGRLGGIK